MSRFPTQGDPAVGRFIRYMEETAKNVRKNYINHLDWLQSKEELTSEPPARMEVRGPESISTVLEEITGNDTLYTAIINLSEMEKQVLLLSVVEDRPMTEVEERLHISFGHVYRLRRTALDKLRAALKRECD